MRNRSSSRAAAAFGPAAVFGAAMLLSPVAAADTPRGAAPERLTLEDAVQRAVARNPNAAVAAEEVRRADALVREARASSFPTLTGNAVYTRLDGERQLAGRVVAGANQLNANLNLTVPLIVPQRWMTWSHASDNANLTRANTADVRRQVAVATARAYLTALSQRRIVEVSQRSRDTASAHLAFAKAQFEGGVGTRIDQVRAAQELAVAETQLQSARSSVVKAQEALGVLVGNNGPVDVTDEVSLPAQPANPAAAEQDATAGRADIVALEARQRNTDQQVRDSWADYAPSLLGTFQPFYQTPASLTQPTTGWQAQLILSIPLYDGGMRYGLADERRAVAAQARAQLEGAKRQAKADVRAAFESVQRADEGLASAREAAKLAAEALDLANQAYAAGATTNLEVIDAERRARDAETSAVIAEDAARQARVDLLVAAGRFP